MTYPSDASSTYRSDPSATYSEGVTEPPPGFGTDYSSDSSASDSSTTEVAREQAAAVGETAAQAGQHVASVTRDEAANVAEQAKYEARNLLHQTRTELSSQASTQQQRAAGGLRSLSSELQTMASKSESDGPATQVARQAADRVSSAAVWLENRQPGEIVTEIQRFARQRPGAFLAIAAAAGVVVGRLTRGIAAENAETSSSSAQNDGSSTSPGNGWQQTGSAAYGTGLDPASAYAAPPPATDWTLQPAPPVTAGGYSSDPGGYAATGQGYAEPGEGGYPQSGPSGYPAPGTEGAGR